jgi:hypothetical protein
MLYTEIIAFYSENHKKLKIILCRKKNSELLTVEVRGVYSYH